MLSFGPRLLFGLFALLATCVSCVFILSFVDFLLRNVKPLCRLLYGSLVSALFGIVPSMSLAISLTGRRSNYPRADDWGHIQVALCLTTFAFLCAFLAQDPDRLSIDLTRRHRVFVKITFESVTIDSLLFGIAGICAATAHLWTICLSGNNSSNEYFHVQTGLVMVCVALVQWAYRLSLVKKYELSDPTVGLGCTYIAWLFYHQHHQPNPYSHRAHAYFSALIVCFGWARSIASNSMRCFCCRSRYERVRSDNCMYIRSKSFLCIVGDSCILPPPESLRAGRNRSMSDQEDVIGDDEEVKERVHSNTYCACRFPFTLLSAFFGLWSGNLFLLSSKKVLGSISHRIKSADTFVALEGVGSWLLLSIFCIMQDWIRGCRYGRSKRKERKERRRIKKTRRQYALVPDGEFDERIDSYALRV